MHLLRSLGARLSGQHHDTAHGGVLGGGGVTTAATLCSLMVVLSASGVSQPTDFCGSSPWELCTGGAR